MRDSHVNFRAVVLPAASAAIAAASVAAAFLLRFDFTIPAAERGHLYLGLAAAAPLKTAVFALARLHRGRWGFVGIGDLGRIFVANLAASASFAAIARTLAGAAFPRSVFVIDFLLCFLATAGMRFCYRIYRELLARRLQPSGSKRILVYGAGAAGIGLLRELRANPELGYEVAGFLDDEKHKKDAVFFGVKVLGPGRSAAAIASARQVHEIVIAMPSASNRQLTEAIANCRAAGIPCKTVPGMKDLLQGKVSTSQIRDVSLADLLGREPVGLDETRIRAQFAGRNVLVTGAGGSIGSELCRQISQYAPRTLVALDQAESDLYRIDLELRQKCPDLNIAAEIADIRDPRRIDEVIGGHRIESVLHAAAYKHVPLMEAHIFEAVRNNVLGTWSVVRAAQRNSVSDFLMISSDKAVNPSNIMGLTKRVAEHLVMSQDIGRGMRFMCVRFGNVLGSNGSVVPLFQQQIAAGGPVTVTHPEIRRYFMTISEAVQLVLQASTLSAGSEIYVLDMGEPVRIADLARNMIRLAGLAPDSDIEIRFTGLRPGEKLSEELLSKDENILDTHHRKIKIFRGPVFSREAIARWIADLQPLLERRDEAAVVEQLKALVPEYVPSERYAARKESPLTASAT